MLVLGWLAVSSRAFLCDTFTRNREEPALPKHKYPGILIAVEGIDGSGKTTQVSLLAQSLRDAGIPVVTSKEPTDGPWGARIRASAQSGRMSLEDELHAFIQDRTHHVSTLIEPALADGAVVILDRYYFSSIAYQGSRGANPQSIRTIMEERFPIPDAVFLLDLDPRLSLYRIADLRGDQPNLFENLGGLTEAREIFLSLGNSVISRVDGSSPIPDVHKQILSKFIDGPLKAKRCSKDYGCDDPYHCSFRQSNTCVWWSLSRLIQVASQPQAV